MSILRTPKPPRSSFSVKTRAPLHAVQKSKVFWVTSRINVELSRIFVRRRRFFQIMRACGHHSCKMSFCKFQKALEQKGNHSDSEEWRYHLHVLVVWSPAPSRHCIQRASIGVCCRLPNLELSMPGPKCIVMKQTPHTRKLRAGRCVTSGRSLVA